MPGQTHLRAIRGGLTCTSCFLVEPCQLVFSSKLEKGAPRHLRMIGDADSTPQFFENFCFFESPGSWPLLSVILMLFELFTWRQNLRRPPSSRELLQNCAVAGQVACLAGAAPRWVGHKRLSPPFPQLVPGELINNGALSLVLDPGDTPETPRR